MSKLFVATGVLSLLLLITLSVDVGRHYYSAENDHLLTNIDQMQRLIIFGSTAVGMYDNENATPHKKGDKYNYYVSGKAYKSTVELEDAPQYSKFDVDYLPDNPKVHSINPAIQLAASRQQLMDNEKVPAASWILLLLSFGGLIYSAIRLKKR